jgi:hypothetical protein
MTEYRPTFGKRFWSKVDKTGDCWVWTAASARMGYGAFFVGKLRPAHRVSWEMANGPIPDGLLVLHRCDNPPCVRPDHLFLGTHAENTADAITKGRLASGERHGRHKLGAEAVPSIRARWAAGERLADIAADFGISRSQVSRIGLGRKWATA